MPEGLTAGYPVEPLSWGRLPQEGPGTSHWCQRLLTVQHPGCVQILISISMLSYPGVYICTVTVKVVTLVYMCTVTVKGSNPCVYMYSYSKGSNSSVYMCTVTVKVVILVYMCTVTAKLVTLVYMCTVTVKVVTLVYTCTVTVKVVYISLAVSFFFMNPFKSTLLPR